MGYPFPGIGILFDIDDLGGDYGYQAWRIFMKNISPRELGVCLLVEGDTALTLDSQVQQFCIGIYGLSVNVRAIREKFEHLDQHGLSPMPRRIMEKVALDIQPLPNHGRVDSFGRLITDRWARTDHDLCKEAGWGYAPEVVPPGLPEPTRTELEEMINRIVL